MMGWKEKFISKASRKILIKTVAQTIPTYSMSLFKLPRSLYDNINSLVENIGGDNIKMKGRFIGLIGRSFALKKRMGEWDFEIFTLLT